MDSGDFKYSGQLAMNDWIWSNDPLSTSLDDKDLADYFIEYHQNSLVKKWDKVYRWAEKPDRYYYGLPVSTVINNPDSEYFKATINYLEQLYGDIDVVANNIDEVEFYYIVWDKLVKDYGYDSKTNELTFFSKQHKYPCYLKDGHLVVTQRTHDEFVEIGLDNPTLAFNFGQIPFEDRYTDIDREQTEYALGDADKFMVTYVYESEELPNTPSEGYIEPIKTQHEYSFFIDLSHVNPELQEGDDIPPDNESVFITYERQGSYYWFSYEISSGLIPQIDGALTGSRVLGQYYPRIYIKHDSQENYDHKDKAIKKSTVKTVKMLGLEAKEVTKSMANSIGGEYGNVRSLYLHMGVKVNQSQDDSILAEYCYRYFERLLSHFPNTEPDTISSGAIRVSDKVSYQEFFWDSIQRQEHTGVISNSQRPLEVKEFCMKRQTYTHTTKKRRWGIFRKRKRHYTFDHVFYQQVSEDKYVSITVKGLRAGSFVSGYHSSFNGDSEHLVLPIDKALIFDLTKKEREYLFHHSLLVNILHVKVTKKKWYQTALFQAVLFVVGVAISVATGGTATGGVMAVLKAVAIAIAKGVVLTLAVQVAIKLAIKLGLNEKHVAILAFIATLVLSAYGTGGFNFSQILHAPNIMKALNTSFEYYQKMLAVQIADIQKQMQDIMLGYMNKQAQLKEVQKLLDTKVVDMHYELLRSSYTPSVNLFETVEMFYSRHNNFNVIEVSHGLVNHYVEGSLNQRKGLYTPINENVEDILLIK